MRDITCYFYPSANWKDRDCQGCEMREIKGTRIVLLFSGSYVFV